MALASTPKLATFFRTVVSFSTRDPRDAPPPPPPGAGEPPAPAAPPPAALARGGERQIVQGTLVRPVLAASTFGGLRHAGLDVSVSVAPPPPLTAQHEGVVFLGDERPQ
jgi:hypothetical protein